MPPRRNRRPTPSPQSSPDRPALLSSQLATPTLAADPIGSLESDLVSPLLASTANHLSEAADSDDPELLDRSHRSQSHSRSRSGSNGPSHSLLPEGMNAARRTSPLHAAHMPPPPACSLRSRRSRSHRSRSSHWHP